MPLDFPTNPANGQIYENYVYDAANGAWRASSPQSRLVESVRSLESSKVSKSGTSTISGANTFSGSNTFANATTFTGTQTFNSSINYGAGVIGQVITYTKSMQVNTSAQNVFIYNDNILPYTGTYLVRIEEFSSFDVGGATYSHTYVGVMQWLTGDVTNQLDSGYAADVIGLHRNGHAPNNESISLRTLKTAGNNGTHALQIYSNLNWSSAKSLTFSFRRIN